MAGIGARTHCNRQRNTAKDKGQRSHDDRAKPQLARLDCSIEGRPPLVAQFDCEFDDQNRVLGSQPHQHQQANLEIDIVFQPTRPGRQQGADHTEGNGGEHSPGQ